MEAIKEDQVASAAAEPTLTQEEKKAEEPRKGGLPARTSSIRLSATSGVRQSNEKHLDQATGTLTQRQQTIQELAPLAENDDDEENKTAQKRYRIQSAQPLMAHSLRYFVFGPMHYTTLIASYMRWSYRATFTKVTLSILLAFFCIIFAFAGLIYWIAYYQPHCIVANEFEDHTYMDSFQLSWTTLSTVGYGVSFPENANARQRGNLCVGINMIMAFEAFCGVLFAGITGAIIYGKITRIQMIALVSFSHPICVRYGTGVAMPEEDDSDEDEEDKKEKTAKAEEIPFPVLEFRILNDMTDADGGEIVDASLKVVATTPVRRDEDIGQLFDALQEKNKRRKSTIMEKGKNVAHGIGTAGKLATKSIGTAGKMATKGIGSATKASINVTKGVGTAGLNVTKGVGKSAASNVTTAVTLMQRHLLRKKASKGENTSGSTTPDGTTTPTETEGSVMDEKELEMVLEQAFEKRFVEKLEEEHAKITPLIPQKSYVVVDEDNSELCPARRVDTLKIETDSHPFFKRTWLVRHELDATSPLWSTEARVMMAHNGGRFPAELNNYEAIRKHLHFQELLVSFSGTSNSSGQTVSANKLYLFDVVNIGYTFAPLLHLCSSSGQLLVDKYLFNDVREQSGGGGEPFASVESSEGLVGAVVEGAVAMEGKAREGVAVVTAKTLEGATAAANAAVQVKEQMVETVLPPSGS